MKEIKIEGAQIHNLKNINVRIPKNKLIAATGVSGSGKSSLMFDIIFEEGRSQYLQSIGVLAGIENENKYKSIEGLGPAIAVQQNVIRQSNPRSTVGTKSAILNLLVLLYAGEGQLGCTEEERLDPSYFSYNAANGMCLKCSGRGSYYKINLKRLVTHEDMTLEQVYDRSNITPGYKRLMEKRFKEYFNQPFYSLPEEVKEDIVYGHYENGKLTYSIRRIFEGRQKKGEDVEGIYAIGECSQCHGYRIGKEGQAVLLNGKHIGQVGKMTISEAYEFLKSLPDHQQLTQFGKNLVAEILIKMECLIKSHLGHLSLYREMSTLSGGEIQRVFLNAHLGAKMGSLIYVLDEPTAGLHEEEKADILKSLNELKELGNTVIVVEHDRNTIEAAEHIIDMGPGAGTCGGQIVYEGNLEGLLQSDVSVTGRYLSGKTVMPDRENKVDIKAMDGPYLTVKNASTNNLKDLTVSFPLGAIVGVAGRSGSGKSSLVSGTLLPLLRSHSERLEGVEFITGYAEVSQAPIGRKRTSNPASYIGIWDKIKMLYARQLESGKREFTPSHFSFNSKGACPVCKGAGEEKIWLGNDLSINKKCDACGGKRFNKETLAVKYKNKNIHEALALSVTEAIDFFKDYVAIVSSLKILERIGMGYIKLGQATPTLSGGEAQRIKLAKEIGKKRDGNILYILDEPTTGLSMQDTAKLVELLDELAGEGNSIIVVEHDPEILKICDWIIELGPGGGEEGGHLIAQGTPSELKQDSKSITGRYL